MIKSTLLEFHETFQPETAYISQILKLASENYSGSKFDISECSGIPTGQQKGKVEPHIRYAHYMGLVNYTLEKGIYRLSLTHLGEEVFVQDPHLHEDLSCWLCHYGMTKRASKALQWEYLTHVVHPGFAEKISQDRMFSLASTWCDVTQENMLKKVFSVVKNSYTEGFFQRLDFLNWDGTIEFKEHSEKFDLMYVYAYALLDSWETLFAEKQEITEFELKNEIGFGKIFGLNEDECNYALDSLAFEGIITLNRQLFPATLIRTSHSSNVIAQIYSRLL